MPAPTAAETIHKATTDMARIFLSGPLEARAPVGVRGLCGTRLQGVGGWGDFLPWARHLMAPTILLPKA